MISTDRSHEFSSFNSVSCHHCHAMLNLYHITSCMLQDVVDPPCMQEGLPGGRSPSIQSQSKLLSCILRPNTYTAVPM